MYKRLIPQQQIFLHLFLVENYCIELLYLLINHFWSDPFNSLFPEVGWLSIPTLCPGLLIYLERFPGHKWKLARILLNIPDSKMPFLQVLVGCVPSTLHRCRFSSLVTRELGLLQPHGDAFCFLWKKKNRPGTLGGRQMIEIKDFCGGIILICLFNLSSALLGAPEFGFREGCDSRSWGHAPFSGWECPKPPLSFPLHLEAPVSPQTRLRGSRENTEHLCNSELSCLA